MRHNLQTIGVDVREIFTCEVCSNTNLVSVLNLGEHPLPDALVPVGTEKLPPTYPIEVLFCEHCYTAHQRFQVPKHQLFPSTYHYRARQTIDVLTGMHQLVDAIGARTSLEGKKVLDVGCNDGSLLNFFREAGATTYGIEPTDAAIEAQAAGHKVAQVFLDPLEAHRFVGANGHPDIITFTNVFAHIEYLNDLLDAVKTLASPTTQVVIENHYLGSVLDRHQFDTFYHEHPRTYSFKSFEFIAERLNMHIAAVEFPQRYGGNIRVTLTAGPRATKGGPYEGDFSGRLFRLNARLTMWKFQKGRELYREYLENGPIACAAFPGRAAILMRLLNLPETTYDAVYEKPGSKKIGFYVPGTHIPIASDELYPMGRATKDTPLLNLAWHIPTEIENRWRARGFPGRIIQCVSETDFTS